jgi:hypothetical protein
MKGLLTALILFMSQLVMQNLSKLVDCCLMSAAAFAATIVSQQQASNATPPGFARSGAHLP